MALLDWSMSILGYPAHRRSGQAVVALSHLPAHSALRLAQRCGFDRGWLIADGPGPQVVDLTDERPHWVRLEQLFLDDRLAVTDGLVGGTVVFVPGTGDESEPPGDPAEVIGWADGLERPWLQMVDNEWAGWGGLRDRAVDALMLWFLGQRPLGLEFDQYDLDPLAADSLRAGLFDHGWTRNGELVATTRKGATVELWGGVHERSCVEHDDTCALSLIQRGCRVTGSDGLWQCSDLHEDCPLDDESGRRVGRVG